MTKRYLPTQVRRWFGKESDLETRGGLGSGSDSAVDGQKSSAERVAESEQKEKEVDPHNYLLAERILMRCENRADLCLIDNFRTEWDDEINNLSDRDVNASEAVSALGIEIDDDSIEINQHGDTWALAADSQTIDRWPSREALLADIDAAQVLDEWSDRWENLAPTQRGEILNGLRLFIKQCPEGAGPVSMSQETVESCCSSHEVITISCDESGSRLFEQRLDEV